MSETQISLKGVIKAVVALAGVGGGFIFDLAPPAFPMGSDPKAADIGHGILVFLGIVLYLIVMGVVKAQGQDFKLWIRRGAWCAVAAPVVLLSYAAIRDAIVVTKPKVDRHLAGLWRDQEWLCSIREASRLEGITGRISNQNLFERIPLDTHYEFIWPAVSRVASYVLLEGMYVIGSLLLFAAIFFIWEGWVRGGGNVAPEDRGDAKEDGADGDLGELGSSEEQASPAIAVQGAAMGWNWWNGRQQGWSRVRKSCAKNLDGELAERNGEPRRKSTKGGCGWERYGQRGSVAGAWV